MLFLLVTAIVVAAIVFLVVVGRGSGQTRPTNTAGSGDIAMWSVCCAALSDTALLANEPDGRLHRIA
jgi:hypothetical protein